MLTFFRRFLMLVLGLSLIVLPVVVRDMGWGYNERAYTPPDVPELSFAATPAPTPTAIPVTEGIRTAAAELRRGPVVVDFAHFSFLNPANLQPLADALADRGLGVRYWISKVNTMALESSAQFPDQSEDLALQLKEASALAIVSPFFLWTEKEIAVVDRFVADGGRLLLVSDPDINGDFPSLLNILAEPFGVVFNDDYLYDTVHNDGNFTFFFNESTADAVATAQEDESSADTAVLADATLAFYGGRSISGAVTPQVRSVETTLSSLRTGQSGFTTVAIGGVAERGTQGRVLALGDFDVLTEAYRVRHDNQRLVEFVADFLSAEQRNNTMVDFPDYLGKEVALSFGARAAIDANLLAQGAQLQQRLETTGRTLTLTNGQALSNTTVSSDGTAMDLIYLADYSTVQTKTTLLTDLGIQIITEAVTITIPVEIAPAQATPVITDTTNSQPDARTEENKPTPTATAATRERNNRGEESKPVTTTGTTTITTTLTVTATNPRASATTTVTEPLTVTLSNAVVITDTMPTTRVEITTYLETADGLHLLADETVLVAQRERADGSLLLAVLGADRRGIDAGVTRLLANDFSDCVIGQRLTFCSLPPETSSSRSSGSSGSTQTEGSDEGGTGDTGSGGSDSGDGNKPETPPTKRAGILLLDDNRAATASESSEADLYLQALIADGHSVDLWDAETQAIPTANDLTSYAWVIWSNGGYAAGKLSIEDMDLVFGYIRQGGRLTLSSRFPLPGIEAASAVRDVVVNQAIPALVDGLPDEPIVLTEEQTAANLSPIAADESGVQIALRRGPASEDAEAPLLVILTDEAESGTDSRFMLMGLGLDGLPEEISTILINNMATWMLAE